MKKFILALAAVLVLASATSPLYAAADKTAPKTAVKKAAAKKSKKPPLVTPVKKYAPPALTMENSWTMVVIGDTQGYVKFLRNQGILDIMLCWVIKNIEPLKIQQVLFTGDMVDQNRSKRIRFPKKNDRTGLEQWQAISRLISRLDGVIPYVVATGNHDYGELSAEDRSSELDKYFNPERNSKLKDILIEMGDNAGGKKSMENAAYRFTTPNGQKLLVVSLGFAPTNEQLKWAKNVFEQNADCFGILLTHSYLRGQGDGRIQNEKYIIAKKDGNGGEKIFNKLVKTTTNIRMVICGHIGSFDNWNRSTNFQISKNDAGKEVYEILFDSQFIGGGSSGSGGDGWLRLMEFSQDMRTIKIRTFSPLFALSPVTRNLAWQKLPINEFTITVKD